MRRRDLLAAAAGAGLFPLAARARDDLPVVGILNSGAPEQYAERIKAYLKGLRDSGFAEGSDVAIEYRWAYGDNSKLPAMAAELVGARVTVIATPASTPATAAAKAATSTIPIVFAVDSDPIKLGFVPSLAHPGGNMTGVTSLNTDVAAKRLGLFRELVPSAKHYFAMVNPTSPLTGPYVADLEAGAASLGIRVDILRASTQDEVDAVLATVAAEPGGVLLSASDAFFYIARDKLIALAAKHAVPMAFDTHEYVDDGGLMSYESDFSDVLEIAGRYTGRILKGEKPADLPIQQSSKFELALNLKTAKALGLTVSQFLLAQATDVVE